MFMDASLRHNSIRRAEVPSFKTTAVRKTGEATWNKKGEWIPESSSAKIRLILSDSKASIAVQDFENRSFFDRIRDHFTHISVYSKNENGKKEILSLNLRSLCKRTQLSVATIFLLRLIGRLSLAYIEECAKKVTERKQVFDRIIENGRAKAVKRGENPNDTEASLKNLIRTSLKSSKIATGIFAEIGKSEYIVHQDPQTRRFTLGEIGAEIGKGAYGFVYDFDNLGQGKTEAVKFAIRNHKNPRINIAAKEGIANEAELLTEIHEKGRVKAIQTAPDILLDLQSQKYGIGYIIKKYDFNLGNLNQTQQSSLWEKIKKSIPLVKALSWLHRNNIFHSDLKPANCCEDEKKLQIADFGGARRSKHISPALPLSVFTPFFSCKKDLQESKRIKLTYNLHQLANGEIKDLIEQALILKKALLHPSLVIDQTAARISLVLILMKLEKEELKCLESLGKKELKRLELSPEGFQAEIEMIKANAKHFAQSRLDLSQFLLNPEQIRQLSEESEILCARHDVYGLGLTLLCYYTEKEYIEPEDKEIGITPKDIETALSELTSKLANEPCRPGLDDIIRDMLNEDSCRRPTGLEAMNRFFGVVGLKSVKA